MQILPQSGAVFADKATVDISGGRLHGIGSGWKQKDCDDGYRFGISGQPLLDDLAAVAPDHSGWNPPPTRDIPVLIGGGGERKTLRLVAEY